MSYSFRSKSFLAAIFLLTSCIASAQGSFSHVMIVVLENTNYSKAMHQPFLSALSKKGASLDNMSALTHPSQGNYVSMIAGDTFGITDDKNIDLDAQHIGDLLEAKGLTWKAYVEGFPGNCFLGAASEKYARKHVPFLSFKNVTTNPARCKNIVNAEQLDLDVQSNNLPNYSIYIPDISNDGHESGVSFADAYMSKKFGPLLQDHKFMSQMLFVLTFDESGNHNNNQIYTTLYGDSVVAGAKTENAYTHYSILKTIETAWGLGSLNKKDATTSSISDVLK
ncbi:MAG: hypothetical protein H7328_03710 [Bdellovibrio sp.]|nr:hypothetical protein [Bdellovibrio sp.]